VQYFQQMGGVEVGLCRLTPVETHDEIAPAFGD
jgi:hypothetical protein